MGNRAPIVTGEWYHCFNRGVDKRTVFETPKDYERFLALLFVCNDTTTNPLSNRERVHLPEVLRHGILEKREPLVEVGAYALMPNHIHLMLRQSDDGGLSKFMQKVFTGYTMSFNLTRGRTGPLFSGAYKSKHISTDDYLRSAAAYILLNPVELCEPGWKKGAGNLTQIEQFLTSYRYTSLPAFLGRSFGHESHHIASSLKKYYDTHPSLLQLLRDAQAYHTEQASKNGLIP